MHPEDHRRRRAKREQSANCPCPQPQKPETALEQPGNVAIARAGQMQHINNIPPRQQRRMRCKRD